MKIRIGVGAAGAASSPDALTELVTGLDDLGFDSLWLSEVLTGPVIDPVVGLAWAAASNPRLKVGTTMLLPGRNVIRLAKQLASLDVLCRGRLLVTLVPGLTYAPERDAIGVEPKRRGAVIATDPRHYDLDTNPGQRRLAVLVHYRAAVPLREQDAGTRDQQQHGAGDQGITACGFPTS